MEDCRHPTVLRDHPRACGEKQCKRGNYMQRIGSPPRVRGKVLGNDISVRQGGITPARAGKRL